MLTHYIIVRRDLMIGTICAQVAHAAGESSVLYQDPENGRFRGATVVVLEVHDERELKRIDRKLFKHNIQRVLISESDPPYCGAWMAIGVVPVERDVVAPILRELQILKLDKPEGSV